MRVEMADEPEIPEPNKDAPGPGKKATIAIAPNPVTRQVMLIVVSPSGVRTTIGLNDDELAGVLEGFRKAHQSLHPQEYETMADDTPEGG